MNNYGYLGIVERGRFKLLVAEDDATGTTLRLTSTAPGGDAPEAEEISLDRYEGRALLVRGVAKDGWICAATIIEEASVIVTAVAAASLRGPASAEVKRLLFSTG